MSDSVGKIMVDKFEYDDLKEQSEIQQELMFSDFVVKLYRGYVLPPEHPNYNDDRIKIEMFSIDFNNLNNYIIEIDGKGYKIKSQTVFNKIKEFVSDNLDVLISWSKSQTNDNLDRNAFEGGMASVIQIKYGQLIVLVNGQTKDLNELCYNFIDGIKELIILYSEKTDEELIKKFVEE